MGRNVVWEQMDALCVLLALPVPSDAAELAKAAEDIGAAANACAPQLQRLAEAVAERTPVDGVLHKGLQALAAAVGEVAADANGVLPHAVLPQRAGCQLVLRLAPPLENLWHRWETRSFGCDEDCAAPRCTACER